MLAEPHVEIGAKKTVEASLRTNSFTSSKLTTEKVICSKL